VSKEVIEIAERLHDYLESMADGYAPTIDLQDSDPALWGSARAYEDLLLVATYVRMLLSDSPSMMGPLGPILKALNGDQMEDELE
jgi:hypothetical protein